MENFHSCRFCDDLTLSSKIIKKIMYHTHCHFNQTVKVRKTKIHLEPASNFMENFSS